MSPPKLRDLLSLAMPMVLARASQSVITFADTLQTKHLGPDAIASVATGGLNVIGFSALAMGTVFIVQSFVSQHVGRGERDATPRYAWYGLAIALITQLVSLGFMPAVEPALRLAGYAPHVRSEMHDYMVIRMFSIMAVIGVETLGAWYGGLGNTWMQMLAGIVSMVTAIFLNWVLIDGHLGAPAMGVQGAAVAATIATWIGFLIMAISFWRRWGMAIGGPAPARAPLDLSWKEFRRVVRFGMPNGLNWFGEFAAFQLFVNVVFGGLGAQTLAAFNVVLAINALGFMPAFGLASAGAILAGQAIGAGHKENVWPTVRLTLACTVGWMALMGSVYALAPHWLLSAFASEKTTPEFLALGATLLLISAMWQLFDATAMTLSETLRAAGDTAWGAVVRVVLAWGVFTPVTLAVVRIGHKGAVEAMICLAAYIALLAAAFAWRFKSGRWRSIQLIEPSLL
ncbi:MAG TPA: MATE family efflux transporter [Kofleriaceae bacterium]|jgi:MATE family multidrug resistance protein